METVDKEPAKNFSWFASYTDQLNTMPSDKLKSAYAVAVANYGTYGKRPCFEADFEGMELLMLSNSFKGIEYSLERSRSNSKNGSGGGKASALTRRAKGYVRAIVKEDFQVSDVGNYDACMCPTFNEVYSFLRSFNCMSEQALRNRTAQILTPLIQGLEEWEDLISGSLG